MIYKSIEVDYLILCLDRLTRFKPTYDKYYRVFYDIFNKYYLGEKKNVSLNDIIPIVSEIFNTSVKKICNLNLEDNFLNNLIISDEKKYFYQNSESEKFLNSFLDISNLIYCIKDRNDVPINLKRLIVQNSNRNEDPVYLREKFCLKYPLEKIVLSEGATEEILLCEFSKGYGYDFNKEGVELVGAGGKRQVARKYYKMIEEVKLPIFILLDKDAIETKELIMPKLRKCDKIYLINSGEFEDIIPLETIINSVNLSFKNEFHVNKEDFSKELNMTKNLKEIYRIKGFGSFNKAEFAKSVKKYLGSDYKITEEMSSIIKQIKEL